MGYEDAVEVKEPDELGHLTIYLSELGLYRNGAMGIIPLDYQEIEAWARLTKTDLKPFEATMIKKMSDAFVSQHNDTNIKSVPPQNDWDIARASEFYADVSKIFRNRK